MPKKVQVGKNVPDFSLPASDGSIVSLHDYRGKKLVIYFYPKDSTPTCTQQACEFRDVHTLLRDDGAEILGISADPIRSHEKFAAEHELPFLLLSDEKLSVCKLFDVWQLKKLYGREYMGIERSTFLLDQEGKLIQQWRKVRLKGHLDQVLAAVKAL